MIGVNYLLIYQQSDFLSQVIAIALNEQSIIATRKQVVHKTKIII